MPRAPYMLLVAPVRRSDGAGARTSRNATKGLDKLKTSALGGAGDHPRRLLGAHPDGRREVNPRYALLMRVRGAHRLPVIINTSFNVRGEPIVCTPEDAYRCFMRTEMDVLVL
jgi:carbamoyltransferase